MSDERLLFTFYSFWFFFGENTFFHFGWNFEKILGFYIFRLQDMKKKWKPKWKHKLDMKKHENQNEKWKKHSIQSVAQRFS